MKINRKLLKKLEFSMDTIKPEKGKVPIKILGYGEISLVFELMDEEEKIAYKRLPIFINEKQVIHHVKALKMYENSILSQKGKLNIPDSNVYYLKSPYDYYTLYIAQEKINPEYIVSNLMHKLSNEEFNTLFSLILDSIVRIWKFNKSQNRIKIALDGQISNWAYILDQKRNFTKEENLFYVDTSTPLFRIDGKEVFEPELFLRSAPPIIRYFLKLAFLQEVVDRYYDLRLVLIDLIANLYKEQKGEIISVVLTITNEKLSSEKSLEIEPLTQKEIDDYYEEDKRIWVIFQTTRKFHKNFVTKILKRHYPFYLPENIIR